MADNLAMDDGGEEASALAPGVRLGRYELLVAIARGGMARVWAARQHGQRGFTKLVAIKTILPHLAREQEFERMFLDEARIASNVHHPNVCETYELGEDNGSLYLAMEWINGDSLSRLLRPTGDETHVLDYRVTARILADACAGLHAAHELCGDDGLPLHVVHRDFSPHNILVSAEGNVKVADFGVAKALGQLHEHTSAGQIKGKLAYMAPEQVAGTADRRSDIFSAGCVLYEATCGVAPFRADNDMQIMHNLVMGNYARPSQRVQGYPPALERIVMQALASDPTQRFQTAEQIRIALEEWLARSGPVVTQANVAHALRARIGDRIDRRRDRIRTAQSASVPDLREDLAGMTPSGRGGPRTSSSASGVKPVLVRGDPSHAQPTHSHHLSQPSHPPYLPHPSQAPPQLSQASQSHPPHFSQPPQRSYSSPSLEHSISGFPGTAPGTTGAFPEADPPEKGPNYNTIGGIAIGVIFALLVGGGGYLYAQKSHGPVPMPTAVVAQTPPGTASGPSATSGISGAPGVPSASVGSATSAPSAAEIELPDTPSLELEVNPPNAMVSVDGQPGTELKAIPKPAPGKVVTLTFRADARDDAVVKVTETTTSPIRVTLKWRARAPTAPAIPSSPY